MLARLSGLAALLLATCALPGARPERPPNVLLILTDDQGWGDLGVHGNTIVDTPRIDALAAESGQMTRFYVSPVCTPTRAALMTGRNAIRTRAIDTFRGRAMMDPAELTIAEVLRDNGYATGLFGKWHLGDSYPMRPQDQGFEEVLGHRGGGLAQPADHIENNRRYTDPILYHNGKAVQTEGFCMDVYTDHALEFMRAAVAEERPFFAYLATNTPHGPFHDVPPALLAKYQARDLSEVLPNPQQADALAAVFAMVENADQNVGRLLDELDALGIADNTIVIYLHDNGPNIRRYVGEMRGMKSEVFEGGIRTPFFVRWPGVVPAGLARAEPAAHVDLWPTLVEATGAHAPEVAGVDGRSLWPLLTNRAADWPERLLHIQAHRGDRRVFDHNFAVIGPRYKLLRASGFGHEQLPEDPAPLQLFDLLEDPLEQHDLAAAQPERVTAMLNARHTWFREARRGSPFGDPPPIVLDLDRVPVIELNRNDWRPTAGGGYGTAGAWRLAVPQDVVVDLTLFRRGPPPKTDATWAVELRFGGEYLGRFEAQPLPHGTATVIHAGAAVRLPATRWDELLEVRLTEGDALLAFDILSIAPSLFVND